ncbi:hypothetical protein [Bifidobacterium catenulatum]|mgnify:FL=1|uniref:Uncharacterized protein n=1 Tax=Bifidobacterium catenulatum PV20-2 TaxID=1447716 RepID=A0A0A7I5J9_9BIFI|nr:hypothetical protein [Bifidobacterium catenulatum]AIZ15527.1 hypothetical protein AH68_09440 [Bifidobacterium catenulatum PV20-2]
MGARRRFGCIDPKPNKKNPTSLEASYPVPVWAYEKFADMLEGKKRLSQRFQFDPKDPEDRRQAEADAEAWLNKVEREINRGTWQPPKREAYECHLRSTEPALADDEQAAGLRRRDPDPRYSNKHDGQHHNRHSCTGSSHARR